MKTKIAASICTKAWDLRLGALFQLRISRSLEQRSNACLRGELIREAVFEMCVTCDNMHDRRWDVFFWSGEEYITYNTCLNTDIQNINIHTTIIILLYLQLRSFRCSSLRLLLGLQYLNLQLNLCRNRDTHTDFPLNSFIKNLNINAFLHIGKDTLKAAVSLKNATMQWPKRAFQSTCKHINIECFCVCKVRRLNLQ